MNQTIRDRLELLLAKIAGRDVDIKTMTPGVATNLKEELLIDIAKRIDRIEESGGGSSAIEDMTDVDIDEPSNGEVLTYNSTSSKWENKPASGGSGGAWVKYDYSTFEPTNSWYMTFQNAISGDFEMYVIVETQDEGETSDMELSLEIGDAVIYMLVQDASSPGMVAKYYIKRTGNFIDGYSMGPSTYQGPAPESVAVYHDGNLPIWWNIQSSDVVEGVGISGAVHEYTAHIFIKQ